MQYFVSAENSSYFYWQLELLIESFLMHGMEDKLVIALAENDDQKIRGYSSNLVKYGKKFISKNEGKEAGYPQINRISSIRYALAYKMLEFPFVMIHADMIMKKPIEISDEEKNYGLVINNYDDFPAAEDRMVKEEVDSFTNKFAEERSVEPDKVTRVPFFSAPVVFNESIKFCSDVFFARVESYERQLLEQKGPAFPCERAAWEIAIAEGFQHFVARGKFMSAPMMHDGEDFNFIHYRSGIPPVFHKKYYKYDVGTYYSAMGPYETILEHNPTVNTNYVHQVIKSYQKRNKN